MKVYVASPLGFSEIGRALYYNTLLPHLSSLGLEILDPWKLTEQSKIDAVANMPYGPQKRDAWKELNKVIAGNNAKAIEQADMVFAVLDGVDVDSGTASEIGCSFALGKRIIGYRGDFRLAGDNEGALINLQVEFFIRDSGGIIITTLAELTDGLVRGVAP